LKRLFQRLSYGWVILAVCVIFTAISYGIRFSFGIFFQSFEQEFNWSRTMISGIFSIYMLFGVCFSILCGWIADRRGAKPVFITMGFLAFAGLALTSRAENLWQVLLSYSLLFSAGSAATYALVTAIATRWFKKRRSLALGIVSSGVGLGSIVIAPITSYLIEGWGWRYAILITGIIALITVPCALLIKRAPDERKARIIVQHHEAPQNTVPYVPERKEDFSLSQAAKTRNFKLLFAIWFFYSFCIFMPSTHLARHAIDIGINPIQAATILSIIGFTSIAGRIVSGILSDMYSRKVIAVISAVIMAAAFAWLTQSTNLTMLYVFAAIFGVGYGSLAPPSTSIVGDTFGVRNIGTIFGVLEVGWVSGAAAGPALAGYIFDSAGTYLPVFWVGVAASFIILFLLLFLKIPTTRT
jgi:MFS family permease